MVKLSIGNKIRISFYTLILLITGSGVFTLFTLNKSTTVVNNIASGVTPTLTTLTQFRDLVKDSKTYTSNWVFVGSYAQDKRKLANLLQTDYPRLRAEMLKLTSAVDSAAAKELVRNVEAFDEVVADQKSIMEALVDAQSYDDPMAVFLYEDLVANTIIPTSDRLATSLNRIIQQQEGKAASMSEEMIYSFDQLRITIVLFGVISALFSILIAGMLSRKITFPIRNVEQRILAIAEGKVPEPMDVKGSDEIAKIGEGINRLIDGFKHTSQFASDIGSGQLDADYQALGEEDALGLSLIGMRDNLRTVINATRETVIRAGQEGKLDTRIEMAEAEGAWKELSEAINSLLISISTPVMEIGKIINALAEGDLTLRYSEHAEGDIRGLALTLDQALGNLNELLLTLSDSSTILKESSHELLTANEEMTVNTGEIASAISEMSHAARSQSTKIDESCNIIEVVAKSSKDMAEQVEQITASANKVNVSSSEGLKLIEEVGVSMNDISSFAIKTTSSIDNLLTRSQEVNKVLSIITELAAQTNLLSLNAAIEAAQAGELGRGFAVVAEEIRKLAEDSKRSAHEIETLINSIQSETKETAEAIEVMNKSIEAGEVASGKAALAFREIAEGSTTNFELSQKILQASQKQSSDINEVVTLTETVVVISEETAAGADEVASSVGQLAAGMKNYLEKFTRFNEIAIALEKGVGRFTLEKTTETKTDVPNL